VQVEYFGDDWPEDLPAWESLAAEIPADPRIALTRQLDGLMKAATRAQSPWRRRGWVAAGLILAVALGAAARSTAVPKSLLADAKAAAAVFPEEKNVFRQWYRASQIDTEAAWQSVIRYFPDKEHFKHHAEQQLALIYFGENDYDRAMPIFESLANLGDDELELKAFGLAGKCGLLSLQGKYEESTTVLAQLLPNQSKLTSEPMRRLLARAKDQIQKNRSKLGPQTSRQWDKWIDQQFHDES
jgi:tetratricopeptide (TPR) repeat protein